MTTMTTMTKFKPTLLFKDDERIEKLYSLANNTIEKLNSALRETENLLDVKFTDDQGKEILEKGFPHAMDLLRKKYPFPNATDEFNLEAMGVDIAPAKKALSSSNLNFKAFKYELKTSEVVLSKEGDIDIQEKGKIYTQNDKQNEAFELAKKMAIDLNTAFEKGFIDNQDAHQVVRFNKLVKIYSGSIQFSINPSFITRIQETGVMSSMY